MKYKIFDVVRLKNKNRATILNVIDKKEISENEIDRQII